ncbi:protein mono-ADP-ribosyltransferase PARP11 [Hyperolius riggenbachi]|uniref:protein mono-ADP-ribosyltransferase PARP11 n=1 Tax=Hyperolius riggenbachi TaxID=752182 RepID=UPI0035A309C3
MTQMIEYGHQMPKAVERNAPEEMDVSETQWGWFYLAECGKWHMFDTSPSENISITSQEIEQRYKENPHGSVQYRTLKFNYNLDFIEMCQTNLCNGRKRPVKRAPFSISAFSYICDNGSIPTPSHWEHVNDAQPYQLVSLLKICNEYKEVASLFGQSMDQSRITKILRVQNLDLWEFYCRKKAQLKKKKGVAEIAEEMLFHGTSNEFVDAICVHNFDWRLNGIHGAVYGKGTYFAKNASMSSQYCKSTGKHSQTLGLHGINPVCCPEDKSKSLFLARVIIGDYVTGNKAYIRPPSKDGSLVNFYDSCVDNPFSPLIYVIFDSNQIYPEYIIQFT